MADLKKVITSFIFGGPFLIILVFFLLTATKILISHLFKFPWIFADETVYAETARNIIHGEFFSKLLYCQTYPPGYSLFLSVANLVPDNSFTSYQIMLVINALLTSSIIFPAYYILKKYCPWKWSIAGAIFTALLPTVILYNFVIMSENLFIPLFLFSLWFLIESFETNSKQWGILTGLSIFLLFFTRTPGIAMIIGFVFALAYYALRQHKSKKIALILKENVYSVAAFCIPTILWIVYKSALGISNVSGYNNASYISSIINAFSNFQSFARFLYLASHELEFLIISSYFIFFILALYWMYKIFRNNGYDGHNQSCDDRSKKILSIQSGIVYVVVSSVILVLLTVTHMFIAVVLQNDSSYNIFGRYIDPIVPIIILFGILGLQSITRKKISEWKKIITAYISINFFLMVLFTFDFPIKNYKLSNMLSIFYVQGIPDLIPYKLFIFLFIGAITIIFFIVLYNKKGWYLLLIFLVIFSILGMNYTIQAQYSNSVYAWKNTHSIVEYLGDHSNESTKIFMSAEDYFSDGGSTWYLTQFFLKCYLIQNFTPGNGPDSNDPDNHGTDYIISQKFLLNNVLAVSKTGYKLYDTKDRKKNSIILPYTISVRYDNGENIENFYPYDTWTRNYSKVLVEYPKSYGDMNLTVTIYGSRPVDNPAHVIFKVNDRELRNVTFAGNSENVTIIVPDYILTDHFQIV